MTEKKGRIDSILSKMTNAELPGFKTAAQKRAGTVRTKKN